ncbi:MAG: nucleotidyltransferase family protein [Phycisphaerales bacterium]
MPGEPRIDVPTDAIADFCRRWKIVEFALFGSVLREDFGPESDVDVLVTFAADAPWSYWEWPRMIEELESVFGRPVDLVEKASVKNPFRRHRILSTHRVIHHAA